MPEDRDTTKPPEGDAQQPLPRSGGEAFRRASNLLAVESQDGDERSRQAFSSLENRKSDEQSSKQSDEDDVDQDEENLDDAVDEKILEDGIDDAKDTARIVRDLNPHNL